MLYVIYNLVTDLIFTKQILLAKIAENSNYQIVCNQF